MADSSSTEIQVNVKGPSELKLQITISTDKSVLELKQAIAEKSEVPADRQRLIYSGRVLKDDDLLSVYKIQSQHTIHMVKGVAKPPSGTPSSSLTTGPSATSQQLPRMQTGQNVHDPLTQLNGHMGFGAMAGLNPFAELGVNQNDPNMMQTMMNSPQFVEQMSAMLSNPQVMDQVIAMNPQLAGMAPQLRETFNSPMFRQMMSNPDTLRMMLNMSSMMGGPLGGAQQPSFPAPGIPGSTGTPGPSATTPAEGAGAAPASGAAGMNPFLNPAMMQQMQQMFGGAGAGGFGAGAGAGADPLSGFRGNEANAFGGFGGNPFAEFGGAQAAAPADTRPPEERFQVQLQQLQDMGFTNAQQNVRALLATAGNVHSAIEYILGGGGL